MEFHRNYFGGVAKTVGDAVLALNQKIREKWETWHSDNYNAVAPLDVRYALHDPTQKS